MQAPLPAVWSTNPSLRRGGQSVQLLSRVVSDSLWPHRLQHARLPSLSPTPGACSNSCTSCWWCHPTISSSVVPFSSCLRSFPAWRSFKLVSSYHQVVKILEFQLQHQSSQWMFRPISFRMDWLDLLAVQGTQEISPTPEFKGINSSALSFLYSTTLTSIKDHWKKHSLD